MSLPQPHQPGCTLEDWKTWEGHWELIHGVAYPTCGMTPAPDLEHQRVSVHLASAILSALKEAKARGGCAGCEVFAAPGHRRRSGSGRLEWGEVVALLGGSVQIPLGLE
jgi:hypothetical protein